MYRITLTEFFKSKDVRAIHCDTAEKANKLLKAFDRMGKRWNSGDSYIKRNYYSIGKNNTCYSNTGNYGENDFYRRNNCRVYEFEEVELKEKDEESKDTAASGDKLGVWVKATDRLPAKSDNYLVTYKFGDSKFVNVCYYENNTWCELDSDLMDVTKYITHWMFLPELPVE